MITRFNLRRTRSGLRLIHVLRPRNLLRRDAQRQPLAELPCFRGEFCTCLSHVRTRCSSLLMLLTELSRVDAPRGPGGLYAAVTRSRVSTGRKCGPWPPHHATSDRKALVATAPRPASEPRQQLAALSPNPSPKARKRFLGHGSCHARPLRSRDKGSGSTH